MAGVLDPELIAGWRRHMESQPRSGLSIEKYCLREGIAAGTFYAWKRRLKAMKATPALDRRKSKRMLGAKPRKPVGSTRAGGFVQVPLPVSAAIEVRFADGTLVSLPSGNLDALSTTLRTLQAAQLAGGNDD